MNSDFELVRLRMLQEYEESGSVDVGDWTGQYPEYRDAIIDYWLLLRGTPRLAQIESTNAPPPDGIAEEAFLRAREAVALGAQWLEPGVAEPDDLDQLGASLERLRSRSFSHAGKAPVAFRRAAVFGWTVAQLSTDRSRVSRLRAQKATYFLERGLQIGLFTEHQQMPFGPYDSTARYKDAEPIAQKQGWLGSAGRTHFVAGPKAEVVAKYASRYLRSMELATRLLEVLNAHSDDELETWATVEWAAHELTQRGQDVTFAAVRQLLSDTPVWRAKLNRANFNDAELQRALQQLVRLRLVRLT